MVKNEWVFNFRVEEINTVSISGQLIFILRLVFFFYLEVISTE
jgi:hypothetical protein